MSPCSESVWTSGWRARSREGRSAKGLTLAASVYLAFPASTNTGTSFNGRTPRSGRGYWGSNPYVPANFLRILTKHRNTRHCNWMRVLNSRTLRPVRASRVRLFGGQWPTISMTSRQAPGLTRNGSSACQAEPDQCRSESSQPGSLPPTFSARLRMASLTAAKALRQACGLATYGPRP